MAHQFPYNPRPPTSCNQCGFLPECGGLEGEEFNRGCFQRCASICVNRGCDCVCPSAALTFEDSINDVGGLCHPPQGVLRHIEPSLLPAYIPEVIHGGKRGGMLEEPWVAVPLYAIVGRNRSRYDVRFQSPASMRKALRLSPHTQVLVTSAVYDGVIEDFWHEHVVKDLLAKIAGLGISAMTTPNFSFMRDVPRTNAIYNLTRIFRISERMSAAGVTPILHLNASTPKDWDRWLEILREQNHIRAVSMEFQTGLKIKERGDLYFSRLCEMRSRLGRNLHPVLLGGSGRIKNFAEHFTSFTAIDGTPFMKTMKRQMLIRVNPIKSKWISVSTAQDELLDGRLESNIDLHRKGIHQRASIVVPATVRFQFAA